MKNIINIEILKIHNTILASDHPAMISSTNKEPLLLPIKNEPTKYITEKIINLR